jgi:hypothetical protein
MTLGSVLNYCIIGGSANTDIQGLEYTTCSEQPILPLTYRCSGSYHNNVSLASYTEVVFRSPASTMNGNSKMGARRRGVNRCHTCTPLCFSSSGVFS